MYSAREGCGFHCTSATSHVPPWGRNRGTSRGASRSMTNKPLRLRITYQEGKNTGITRVTNAARTTSREEGLILIYHGTHKSDTQTKMDPSHSHSPLHPQPDLSCQSASSSESCRRRLATRAPQRAGPRSSCSPRPGLCGWCDACVKAPPTPTRMPATPVASSGGSQAARTRRCGAIPVLREASLP